MRLSHEASPEPGWPALAAPAGALEPFEESLGAIWARARACLGGATLKALFDRVLLEAQERWPHLAFVETSCSGLRFHRDHSELAQASAAALEESFQYVVPELVQVLGSVSGQVLSRPLRAAVEAACRRDSRA